MTGSASDGLHVKRIEDGRAAEASRAYEEMLGRMTRRIPFRVTRLIVHRPGLALALDLSPPPGREP